MSQTTAVQPAEQAQPAIVAPVTPVVKYDPYAPVTVRPNFGEGERSQNISIQYLDLNMGEKLTLKYLGIMDGYQYANKETGELCEMSVACFMDKNGNRYVNGAIELVKTVSTMPSQCEIDVTWSGMKKTASGNQKRTFTIQLINGSWE